MILSCLPTELLLATAAFLTKENDINSLARTNRRFYALINPYLYRYNPRFSRIYALFLAIRHGNAATARTSIQNGGNVTDPCYERGRTLLFYAVEGGNGMIVKVLLDTGKVNVNSRDPSCHRTPLSRASIDGREAIVKMLLDTGKVDVDSRDEDGRTPLSWASERGHEAVVKMLLGTSKVDVDLQN